jgi:hypothetical protein
MSDPADAKGIRDAVHFFQAMQSRSRLDAAREREPP